MDFKRLFEKMAFLFHKSAASVEPPAEQVPKGVLETNVRGLETELRAARAVASKEYEKPLLLKAAEIAAEAKVLLPLLDALSKKELHETIPQYKIGLQERDAYSKRIRPLLLQLAALLTSVESYSSELSNAVSSLLKATFDNRYIFHFFQDEMNAMGAPMKKIGELSAQYEEEATKVRSQLAEFDAALAKCVETQAAQEDCFKGFSEKTRLQVDCGQARSSLEELLAKHSSTETENARTQLTSLESDCSLAKEALANALNPFQRSLRKHAKMLEDEKSAAFASSYAETPVEAVLVEFRETGDFKQLRQLLEGLAAAVEEGRITDDDKERLKILGEATRVCGGSIRPQLEKFFACEKTAREINEKIASLETGDRIVGREKQRVQALETSLAEAEKQGSEYEEKRDVAFAALQTSAEKLLARKVVLKIG
ncbi:hypothetical protein AUJ65_06200 [Candidatus Micrarchaeota archaeon CG1_02_51_15]|nr:MAG: hypothetical protein AUJ65_06200 [Candidatus Micrarchaeota archaeon CG1_02_51_15]